MAIKNIQFNFRLVEEALDCVVNERLTQNVGTTTVMAAPSKLVNKLVYKMHFTHPKT